MRRSRSRCVALWCLGAVFAAPAFADDCAALYDQARSVAASDTAAALRLLDEVTTQCPTAPHGWFLAGNVHREGGDHAAARRAYRQAAAVAEQPRVVAMAKAYAALATFQIGELCEAQRAFRSLVPNPAKSVPEWLREPWEAFARLTAETQLSSDQIACALTETAADRNLGVCPRVNLRIEFDYDSADIRADARPRIDAMARALADLGDEATSFRLVGHTDARGDASYNQRLSERRSQSVRRAVLALRDGLDLRVDAIGKGASEPLVPGNSEADHRVNRRVELRVICGAAGADTDA